MLTSEFQNKTALPTVCSCGKKGFVLVDDVMEDGQTTCGYCQKKIFQINCKKCESGFSFPESVFDPNRAEWKCEWCHKMSEIPQEIKGRNFKFYFPNEIPSEMTETILSQAIRFIKNKLMGKK